MSRLTKKQSQMLAFIKEHLDDRGYAPTYREIAKAFGLSSTATVSQHVKALLEKGVITMGEDGEARSIEIIEVPMDEQKPALPVAAAVYLPLAGLITAGSPIEAVEENEMTAVPASFVIDGSNSFVLRVKGRSMIEDGIFDGDYVVVERNPSPRDGDIVVALLDNAFATLKRFYREKDRIRLQPANSAMDPIYVRDCIVQGVVRAIMRRFEPA